MTHLFQDVVRPVLQRQVEMRRQPRRRRDEIDDLHRAVHRLERTDSEEHIGVPLCEYAHERGEGCRLVEIASVRSEVYTGNRDFAIAGGNGILDLADDCTQGTRSPSAPGGGDDAVAALLVAASLDAERQRRSPDSTR